MQFRKAYRQYSKANYWEATAANAIKPLQDMIVMATDNLMEKDVVWS